VQILEANGVATKQEDYYLLDMDQLLDMFVNNVTWADLEDNSGYDVNKRVLISSTDVRSSNSAAMLLALASFVLNDNNIVQDTSEVAGEKMDILTNLFQAQGFQAGSSAVPFNDYLTMGIGKAPIVMIYESQFIYQSTSEGGMKPGMVLVYPQPTIYTKHFIIALSEEGDLLGKLLRNDPDLQEDPQLQEAASELQKLAIEHGFRNADATYFAEFTRQNNVVVSDTLVNVIEPPTYEVLEAMIQDIEQRY
jgi:hypothetical protein